MLAVEASDESLAGGRPLKLRPGFFLNEGRVRKDKFVVPSVEGLLGGAERLRRRLRGLSLAARACQYCNARHRWLTYIANRPLDEC